MPEGGLLCAVQLHISSNPQQVSRVPEEHLLVYDEDDADTFVKYLHGKNCRVQKITESAIADDTLFVGKLGNMIRFAEKPDEPGNAEHASCDCGHDECSGHDSHCHEIHENLTAVRGRIEEILGNSRPGDVIYSRNDREQKKKEVAACRQNGSEEEQMALIGAEYLFLDSLQVLQDNDLAEKTPEGVVLRKIAAPDEMIVERRAGDPDAIDPEHLKSHEITLTRRITFDTSVRVATEPRLYFTCQPEELEKVLLDRDIDEATLETFLHNQYLKSLAIENVMKTIEATGKMALPDLIAAAESGTAESGEEELPLSLTFSPAFVTGLVNDLRKIGALEGNDPLHWFQQQILR